MYTLAIKFIQKHIYLQEIIRSLPLIRIHKIITRLLVILCKLSQDNNTIEIAVRFIDRRIMCRSCYMRIQMDNNAKLICRIIFDMPLVVFLIPWGKFKAAIHYADSKCGLLKKMRMNNFLALIFDISDFFYNKILDVYLAWQSVDTQTK